MSRPAIVIAHMGGARLFDDVTVGRLDTIGRVLDPEPLGSWDDPRAEALLGEAEIIVGHWGTPTITAELLARAPKLALFAYAAGTIKWSMSDDAWEAREDLVVTSGASANAEPVAEYTLAMILLANKRVFPAIDTMRGADAWTAPDGAPPHGNWDKTVGLVSASLIGRRVAELLQPFPHLDVKVFDPYVDADAISDLGATKVDDLRDLCRASDVLSIHAPALPATHNLIGADELAALPDGATVINTARGHCLDLDALVAELEPGRLFAVIDVTDPVEPLPDDHPLRHLPNAIPTPHIAGSQGTELGRMSDWVCDEVERFVAGRPQRNRITRDMIDRIA
ncbi:MAG: hydroxyacid dehydrogenase [Actinomycetota bacterium]